MSLLPGKVLFAIPKKGRLYSNVLEHLKSAGIYFRRRERSDMAFCSSIPEIVIFFLPARDIAYFVGQGDVDFGITGLDVIEESRVEVNRLLTFDFGRCSLCLQVPLGKAKNARMLAGKKIVTSFPNLAQDYLDKFNIRQPPEIRTVSGSVEVACQLGLADAVIDLVQTGETMRAAGLEAVDTILESSPLLIANPNSRNTKIIETVKKRLTGIKIAEKYAVIEYNIKKELRHLGEAITPGYQSPTVLPLEDTDWVAIKAMVVKSEVNEILDKLQKVGATAILVYNINNCRV